MKASNVLKRVCIDIIQPFFLPDSLVAILILKVINIILESGAKLQWDIQQEWWRAQNTDYGQENTQIDDSISFLRLQADIDRLYFKRSVGGRGFMNVEDSVE